jgi:hypothetical protein
MLDAGLRPRPFPDDTASLLPGLLAATRTGLTPASDDELTTALSTTHMINHLSTGRTMVITMTVPKHLALSVDFDEWFPQGLFLTGKITGKYSTGRAVA